MIRSMFAAGGTALLMLLVLAGVARAEADIDAKAKAVARSLVIVDYTIKNENVSREDSGQGLVLNKEGVILVSGGLIPESLPREWIADIKVRLPDRNFATVPAKLLGRTRNRLFAYLKTDEPITAPPFVMGDTAPSRLGQEVFAVAVMGKNGGYQTYVGKSDVRAVIELSHTVVTTASFGLTRGNSPVFDRQSGAFIGLTLSSLGESMILRDGGDPRRIELADDEQSSSFLPLAEVQPVLSDVPARPFDLRRAWLAVDDLKGIDENLRELRKIQQAAGVMIGSVIAGEAADKAGLQPRDIVLTIDGKEFSGNPVPEMMLVHFQRAIDNHVPDDKLVLGVLRDGKRMDIPVTLGAWPKLSSEMAHVFSAGVGVVTRDLVFLDAYTRRLPQDTKGVMIALVKSGSPASLGATPLRAGLLITKVDDRAVENQQQFLDVLKEEEAKKDLKEMVFVVIQRTGETQVCRIDMTK